MPGYLRASVLTREIYTLKQIEGGNYVEMYYFTNQGLGEVKRVVAEPSDGIYFRKNKARTAPAR